MTNDRRRMRNRGDHYDIACFPPDRTTPAPGSWTETAALFPYDQSKAGKKAARKANHLSKHRREPMTPRTR
ncbi:hypothetical protein QC761_0110730 [Podospora bellae-mahoneyi]|uniref:Uncharacterized protein n=1 Tax=Podospora bellae-mahoneyi TaxID=2093777 RepID=A0ABR0F6M2_9PEZI|nr:hypothetical protein QC761_0110730 [Podospora bellae-mahoneyi]